MSEKPLAISERLVNLVLVNNHKLEEAVTLLVEDFLSGRTSYDALAIIDQHLGFFVI